MADEKKDWIGARLINPEDKERDVKLLVFVLGTATVAVMLWREQSRGAITSQWVDAVKWFLLSISLGGAGWAYVDKLRVKPKDDGGDQ